MLWFKKLKNFKWIFIAGFLLVTVFGIVHLYLVSDTFVVDNAGSIRTTFEGFGDIPLHLTQISKFAYAPNFNLNEPIFYGEKLHYPFLINLFSGLLLRITGWFTFSVMFPIYLLVIFNLILLVAIYNKLFKNLLLTGIAIWIFMLGAGFGSFPYFSKALTENYSIEQVKEDILNKKIITILNWDAKYPSQNIDFSAPMPLVLVHQRTSLLGLFGFLLFLYLLIQLEFNLAPTWKNILGPSLVFGLLPMANTHSFVAVAMTVVSYGVFLIIKRNWSKLKNLFWLAFWASILAIPQLWYLVGSKSAFVNPDSFSKFRLGWMVSPTIGSVQFPAGVESSIFSLAYLHFLTVNFGVILLALVFCGVYFAFRYKKIKVDKTLPVIFLFSSLFLFLVVQVVRFQPWDFDNNKVLVYYQFFAVAFTLWLVQVVFVRYKKIMSTIIVIYFVATTLTGFIDIIPRMMVSKNNLPEIFNISASRLSFYIRYSVPKNQLILTSATHLNPVSSLAGREVLIGYPGWLWTRGLDYGEREQDLKDFYRDPKLFYGVLDKYKASYILVELMAVNDYQAKREVFDQLFDKIFEDGQYSLYQVKK